MHQVTQTAATMKLYHGTSSNRIPQILSEGLNAPSHWGTIRIASFFARRECKEVGGQSVLIAIHLNNLDERALSVDTEMLDFPVLTDIAGADHGELETQWEDSKQSWRDSLDTYESVVYAKRLTITTDMLVDHDDSPIAAPTPA